MQRCTSRSPLEKLELWPGETPTIEAVAWPWAVESL